MQKIIFFLVIFHFFSYGCGSTLGICVKPHWFLCDNGRCLSQIFVCDGEDDCNDNSDERNCTGLRITEDVVCNDDQFRCLDNNCISQKEVCDGSNDCLDGSDEILGCTLGKNCDGFQCKNGFCIMTDWVCDGTNDCSDNSDEENCYLVQRSPEQCTHQDGFFLCKSQQCISIRNACDNKKDCSDGSDEDVAGCNEAETECARGTCNHLCSRTPKGAVCSCRNGYHLISDRVCSDINECDTYGICDQKCENLEGSYKCSCESGYTLQDDKKSCKADAGEALMIYSSKTDIRGFYITSEVMFDVARKLQHVVGVSLDTEHVYWSDVQLGDEAIVRSKEDGSDREVIITAGLGAPEDIAVDWVTGNLYFTDGQMKHIAVCTNNGSSCTVVMSEEVDSPRGISLLPSKGEMFWSDWGAKPQISKANMDGKNIVPLITNDIAWPNGLTIDYPNQRLYWVDAKLSTIETTRFDGSDRRVVLRKVAKHPYSIAVFESKVYWSDWQTNSIQMCNKFTGKDHATLLKEKKSIYGVHIYHSTLKPQMPNPCAHGLCSHICLLAANASYSCACPADKELGSDKHSCRVTEKQKKLMIGAGHMFIEVHHEVLGKPKLTAALMQQHVMSLTYDPLSATILASDQLKNWIFRYDPTTGERMNLVTTNIGHVGGMDFDYLGRNLYWCDTVYNNIEVYSVTTDQRMTLNSERLDAMPLDLAVIPEYGMLYVVLKTIQHIHIDKMYMNGLGSRTHVIETGLVGPSVVMTYDAHLDRIFWADQGTGIIESTSLEGTERHKFRSNLNSPVSLAILGNEIFWTNYGSRRLYWADKTGLVSGNKKITLDVPENLEIMHLVAMTATRRTTEHKCLKANGGCSHICLVVSAQSHMCACPSEMMLSSNDNQTCVSHHSCKVYEMKCLSDDSCIDKSKKCDGNKDCPNGEDEIDCRQTKICGVGQFRCRNNECISKMKICDSNYDCADRSDEEDCTNTTCAADEFQCRRGYCVSSFAVCNGRPDCPDGLDEENCHEHTCDPDSSFTCKSGGCIPKFWKCDGQIDCDDGSDEDANCDTITCSPNMYVCQNGHCLDTQLVCNLIDDCGDMSDERKCVTSEDGNSNKVTCGPGEYRCYGGNQCIPIEARCDGRPDCPKEDDELLCTDCEISEFTCANKKCIPLPWVCDREDDCGDKSDEKNCDVHPSSNNDFEVVHCEEYRCMTGACISYANVCNKVVDCFDHSDEDGKCDTACDTTNPCTGICHKTPGGPICTCHKGYTLRNDGFTCEDIDECKLGICSQNCRNEMGSFSCSCFNGFLLRSDGVTCKVAGPPMEVIMTTKNDVRKISQSPKTIDVLYSDPDVGVGINGVDLNIGRKMIYWSTGKKHQRIRGPEITGTIYQYSLKTNEIRNVTKIGKPRTLAVDWTTDNVFFYDSAVPHAIKVCNLEERKCAHVRFVESATVVNALAADPHHGWIFWGQTDSWMHNNPTSEIYRADMSGANPRSITSSNLGIVSGLAIDHSRARLYWADSHLQIIESAELDGKDRRIVIHSNVHRPFGLSLFEDTLFWLTPGTGQMTSCSMFGANPICNKVQISSSHNEEQFALLQSSRQPSMENVCHQHNCDYMCVVSESKHSCLCQDGTTVSLNEKCSNVTILNPEFGDFERTSVSSGYLAGTMIVVIICLTSLAAYYLYQKRKIAKSCGDVSVHFENPTFGRDPPPTPTNTAILPDGQHEFINHGVGLHSKFPLDEKSMRRTLQLKEDEILTSESEDGNYLQNTRLI